MNRKTHQSKKLHTFFSPNKGILPEKHINQKNYKINLYFIFFHISKMSSQRQQINEEGKSVWDNRRYGEFKKDTSGAKKTVSTTFKVGKATVHIERYSTDFELISIRAPNKSGVFMSRNVNSFEEIVIYEETKKKKKLLWHKSFGRDDEYNFSSPEESEEEEEEEDKKRCLMFGE